jgi:tetratricopeptide (TPR) repeat protein
MDTNVSAVRAAANTGIEALNQRRPDKASAAFTEALKLATTLKDPTVRREETAALGNLFLNLNVVDLAQLAYEEAVDLDAQLGTNDLLGLDTLELGNAHSALGNEAEAEQCFRDALEILRSAKKWANAASASTNLGGIIANRGDMAEGMKLMEQSLGYLAKEEFPDTELQTRFGLLQIYELAAHDVERAVDNARTLFAKFYPVMVPAQRAAGIAMVDTVVARYCAARPKLDCAKWRKETFPML